MGTNSAKVLIDPTWERQPGESPSPYAGFRAYRDLGPGRTLNRAVEFLIATWPETRRSTQVHPQTPRFQTTFGRFAAWSPKWHWVERCEDYDAHLDHVLIAVREEASRSTAHLLEARRIVIEEREAEMSTLAFKAVVQILSMPVAGRIESVDGKTITYQPNDALARSVAQVMKEASRLGRLSAGLPTEGARMPSPPFDTKEGSDIEDFFKKIAGGGEASPSKEVPDAVEAT